MQIIKNAAFKGERFAANEIPVFLDWDEDGKSYTKFFNLVYEPLPDENNNPNGVIAFGYEITDQIKARQEILI